MMHEKGPRRREPVLCARCADQPDLGSGVDSRYGFSGGPNHSVVTAPALIRAHAIGGMQPSDCAAW